MSKISSIKFLVGTVVIIIGILFISGRFELQTAPGSESFASEPVKINGFDLEMSDKDNIPKMIIIPALNMFLDVRMSEIRAGYWEVFEDVAGWGMGSGIPGESGNQVIFAHARDGLFAPLKNSNVGMRVLVLTENNWFEYKITMIDEVLPGDTKYIQQTENEILTLYTCSGFNDSKRLIVVAEPVQKD